MWRMWGIWRARQTRCMWGMWHTLLYSTLTKTHAGTKWMRRAQVHITGPDYVEVAIALLP